MRGITYEERRKYGCCDCSDLVSKMWHKERRTLCPHDKCPYKELNDYDSFDEYLKENQGDTELKFFLQELGKKR